MTRITLRRPAAWRLAGLLLLALLGAPLRAAGGDRTDFAQAFEKITRTARDNFYDPGMNGLDWAAVSARYRKKAEAARSHQEFAEVVNRMLRELRASHLAYLTDDEMEFYMLQTVFSGDTDRLQMEHIGVTGERENGVFVVRAVLEGGPAAKVGVRVGDRLLEASGRPFSTVGAFKERANETISLIFERPGKGRMTVGVVPVKENPQRAFLNATRKSVRLIERAGKRIGYLHLWCMTHDLFRQALEETLIGKLADTDALILDLRDGFGGHPFRFNDVLFRPDVRWGEIRRGRTGKPIHTGYAKPMALLINRGTRSAKEFFSVQMKKSGRAILVGTTTAGAFLGAGGFPITSEGYLELPVVGLTLDDARIEGVGVPPDVMVEPEDTYGPDDRQLARAADILLERLRGAAKTDAGRKTKDGG